MRSSKFEIASETIALTSSLLRSSPSACGVGGCVRDVSVGRSVGLVGRTHTRLRHGTHPAYEHHLRRVDPALPTLVEDTEGILQLALRVLVTSLLPHQPHEQIKVKQSATRSKLASTLAAVDELSHLRAHEASANPLAKGVREVGSNRDSLPPRVTDCSPGSA